MLLYIILLSMLSSMMAMAMAMIMCVLLLGRCFILLMQLKGYSTIKMKVYDPGLFRYDWRWKQQFVLQARRSWLRQLIYSLDRIMVKSYFFLTGRYPHVDKNEYVQMPYVHNNMKIRVHYSDERTNFWTTLLNFYLSTILHKCNLFASVAPGTRLYVCFPQTGSLFTAGGKRKAFSKRLIFLFSGLKHFSCCVLLHIYFPLLKRSLRPIITNLSW